MPFISVILPIYNAQNTLLDALESLSKQTFKDFEIIAINDGSTDKSLEILKEYSKRDSRLKILTRGNKKLIFTLNEGIELANGKYIARMDADDISCPERFEKQLKYIENNKLDVCGSWAQCFGLSENILKLPVLCEELELYALFYTPLLHPTVIGKTEIFKKYRYNYEDVHAEDFGLWLRLLVDGYKLGNIPEILLNYRISNTQISYKFSEIQIKNTLKLKKWYRNTMNSLAKFEIPDLLLTFNLQDVNQLKESIKSLIQIKQDCVNKFFSDELINMIDNAAYRLLLNGGILGLSEVLKCLKRYSLTNKKQVLLILNALFRLPRLKNEIKKNKKLLSVIRRMIDYY